MESFRHFCVAHPGKRQRGLYSDLGAYNRGIQAAEKETLARWVRNSDILLIDAPSDKQVARRAEPRGAESNG